MTHETKERVTFMAASLFDLAEMTESDLPSVVEVVGIDAIRDLMECHSGHLLDCVSTALPSCWLLPIVTRNPGPKPIPSQNSSQRLCGYWIGNA